MVIGYRGQWFIPLTFLIAFAVTYLPLPLWIDRFWPDWVSLVLIYWCLALPQRVNVGTAWVVGLFQDAAAGTLLGQHALALAVIAFLTVKTHQRIRVNPLWQQALSVLGLLIINQLLVSWIDGITGYPPQSWWYLAPAFGGMLWWPWLFIALRDLRRRFRIS